MLRLLLLAVVALSSAACAVPLAAGANGAVHTSRPNIVLFVVDDLGWQDLSVPLADAPTPFNARYVTPAFERLAREGVRFTDGYASAPVCTPTRAAILTGRSPGASHITYWVRNAGRDTSREWKGLVPPQWRVDGVQPGEVTLPGLLTAAGYRTIHVGKAHWGAVGTPGADPLALGFDVNVAGHGLGAPGSYFAQDGFGAGGAWAVPGLEDVHGSDAFLTEVLAERACDELRRAVDEAPDRPFFLHLAPYAVHTPIQLNPRYAELYAELPARERAYASLVTSADAMLGAALDLLDELHLAGDTLVVFTSDNGGLSAHGRDGEPHTHNAPLASGKGSAYEGGVRVPWIVRWPGVAGANTVCREPVISHDLFPTLLAAAGVAIPVEHAQLVEGTDLRPVLRGEPGTGARPLFWHQPHFWGNAGPGIQPYSAVRLGDHKLIWFHGATDEPGRGLELYDLARDPGETRDLASSDPKRVDTMLADLDKWITTRNVQLSICRDDGTAILPPLEPSGGSNR
ncbi:Arylsulfatase precursor [Planctomycetes bacterium Pla163]|uniref:Arylsulfatase n=1 Tax=Rohdeia mirabilis TaxID=2528008 RepID=A0A518D587_9BACT|nr:Arylsulfatase precursor [Planctomycetes bacterium Pla163]